MKYLHVNGKSCATQVALFSAGLALLSLLSCGPEAGDESVASSTDALTLGPVNVLTAHYDNGRTGANTQETILKPSNVNNVSFGLRFQAAVDNPVFAGILYASQVPLAGGNKDVFYAATMNNSVYAFDADVGGSPLWQKNFNGSGRPTHSNEVGGNCSPYQDVGGTPVVNVGIVGTPVIDPASGLIYVVTRTIEGGATFQRLHALNILNGNEGSGSPVVIGAAGFDPVSNNQRPGLALANGRVYIGFSSFCDTGGYHGLIFGYSTANLAAGPQVYNVTPSGTLGGIWMGGAAPAVDASGNIYTSTGNGTSDAPSNNLAESLVKLSGASLGVADFFMASNFAALNSVDNDFGSGGPVLLPGVTNRIVTGSKEGKIYLIKTDAMGHVSSGDSATAQVFQAVDQSQRPGATYHVHNAPVAWQGPAGLNLYVWGENDLLRAYRFNTGSGTFNTPAFATGNRLLPQGMPGGMMTLSSSGSTSGTGVLWATAPASGDANHSVVPGVLRAFNAETLALLWESTAVADDTQTFAKFNPPIVANGRVYVPSFSNVVSVYGLAQAPSRFVTANIPGTIEAENFDNGSEGVTYHDVDLANQGGAYRSSGVDIQTATEGAFNVGWISTGEWLRYTVNVASTGTYNLTARVATQPGGGSFHVEMDGTDVTGLIAVGPTGGWATWATVSKNGVSLSAGQHTMRVFMDAGNFNLNNLTFSAVGGYAGTPFGGTRAAIPGTVQAENYDLGGENVAYHDNEAANLGNPGGNTFRTTEGVDTENTTDTGGGSNVGWTNAGEWLMYSVNIATTGSYNLTARVASQAGGASFHVELDGNDVTGSIAVGATGGWQSWATVTKNGISLSSGLHLIRVFEETGGFNLNSLTFSAAYTGTPFGGTRASIPGTVQAENYDVGGEGVAYHDNEAANLGNPNGNAFRTTEGVDLENTTDTGGGSNLGWTNTGEWLMYSVNVTTTRAYTVTFRAASGLAVGTSPTAMIRLEVDGVGVTGDQSVTPTGNWQGWSDVNVSNINLTQGDHLLRVFIANTGLNLNYVRIQ